jgi:hypothetical protein
MITFWGEVALTTLAGYATAVWVISKIQVRPRPRIKLVNKPTHDPLQGSNKDRSSANYHGWY